MVSVADASARSAYSGAAPGKRREGNAVAADGGGGSAMVDWVDRPQHRIHSDVILTSFRYTGSTGSDRYRKYNQSVKVPGSTGLVKVPGSTGR